MERKIYTSRVDPDIVDTLVEESKNKFFNIIKSEEPFLAGFAKIIIEYDTLTQLIKAGELIGAIYNSYKDIIIKHNHISKIEFSHEDYAEWSADHGDPNRISSFHISSCFYYDDNKCFEAKLSAESIDKIRINIKKIDLIPIYRK